MVRKWVVVGVMFFFICATVPLVQANTDYFSNSMVVVVGKCNTVTATALWLFGLKVLLNKKILIQSSGGEGEKINALVIPPKLGVYFGHKNIMIQMEGASGLIFWGEKSILLQRSSQRIVAFCKVKDLWITYD
jgi:hypothetical protein